MVDEQAIESVENLNPQSYVFIRGLIDSFLNKREYQFDTRSPMWSSFVKDVLDCARKNNLKRRVIFTRDGQQEYLYRYYFINERPKIRVTLHQTLISDLDGFHNHPWDWASLILSGGYFEETPDGNFFRPEGHFRVRTKDDFHKLVVNTSNPLQKEIWTLFIMGEKQQDWGFLKEDGTVQQWQQYLLETTGRWYPDE